MLVAAVLALGELELRSYRELDWPGWRQATSWRWRARPRSAAPPAELRERVEDVPHGRLWLAPWLPARLPELEVRGILAGDGRLAVRLVRRDGRAEIADADGGGLQVAIGSPEAPPWGDRPGTGRAPC